MKYEAWRISYQSSEQAARAAFAECQRLDRERDKLVAAIERTLDENGHLADGENCTLIELKRVIGLSEHKDPCYGCRHLSVRSECRSPSTDSVMRSGRMRQRNEDCDLWEGKDCR